MKNFVSKFLHEALISRKQTQVENCKTIIISMVVFVLIYILVACLLHPSGRDADYHFSSERGLITALSAVFLSMAGSFSLATLVVHFKRSISNLWPWALMAVGFFFLALDETAQFHERLGDVLDDEASSGVFRHWNDIIVILYGILALPFIAILLPTLLRYKMVLELFVIAFVFYVIHTSVDSVYEPPTTATIIVEESAKLYCGAFLTLSALFGFLGALSRMESTDG